MRRRIPSVGPTVVLAVCLTLLALPALLASVAGGQPRPQSLAPLSRYEEARALYYQTEREASLRGRRSAWQRVIAAYREMARKEPKSPSAPSALFMVGKLHERVARQFRSPANLDKALAVYRKLSNAYPSSTLADDALLREGIIYLDKKNIPSLALAALNRIIERFPRGDKAREARSLRQYILTQFGRRAPANGGSQVSSIPLVTHITQWSNPRDTRVVLHAENDIKVTSKRLRNPDRLFFDLQPARLSPDLHNGSITVDNGVLKRIRSAQNDTNVVRVVLDLKSIETYQVFSLHDPYRIVIDVQAKPPVPARSRSRKGSSKPSSASRAKSAAGPGGAKARRPSRQPFLVIIDPGHGGRDAGAVSRRGLLEKNLTLDIAKRLGRLLEQQRGAAFKPVLTRRRDVFVPLEARTALANTENGDLFISIHTNAARSASLRGIETYFLNPASSERERRVAARENNTTLKKMSDIEFILNDLILNSKLKGSSMLASMVQKSLVNSLQSRYQRVRSLGVKRAPFYVLLGARMPSILVETAFLTNPLEEKRLRSRAYRQLVAKAMVKAIKAFSVRAKLGKRADLSHASRQRLAARLFTLDRHAK